jgi:hypothetical protein
LRVSKSRSRCSPSLACNRLLHESDGRFLVANLLNVRDLKRRNKALRTTAFSAFVNVMHEARFIRFGAGKSHLSIALYASKGFIEPLGPASGHRCPLQFCNPPHVSTLRTWRQPTRACRLQRHNYIGHGLDGYQSRHPRLTSGGDFLFLVRYFPKLKPTRAAENRCQENY